MVAGVQNAASEFPGVAVTWLSADGTDKAPVETPREIFGPIRGGAVRLAPPSETLAIAEGIEIALSVLQATGIPTGRTALEDQSEYALATAPQTGGGSALRYTLKQAYS